MASTSLNMNCYSQLLSLRRVHWNRITHAFAQSTRPNTCLELYKLCTDKHTANEEVDKQMHEP